MACVQAPCARLACRQRGTAPAPGHGEHGALPRKWDGANAAFSPAGCREPPNQLTQENDLALCLLDRAIGHRHQGPERQSQPGPRGSKAGGKRGSHESQGRDSAACGERRAPWWRQETIRNDSQVRNSGGRGNGGGVAIRGHNDLGSGHVEFGAIVFRQNPHGAVGCRSPYLR